MRNFTSKSHQALILLILLFSNAYGATKIITQTGNWSSTATWGGNPAPTSNDDVIINGNFSVTIDISNAACLSLQLGGSSINTGAGILVFSNGSQLSISGVLNIGPFNNTNTAGSLNMASGGTLKCEGITVGRLGTWNAGSGTIEFTATNTIPSNNNVNFNNLTMSGGTTSMTHNLTVSGNLLINSGGSLDGGANTLSLAGNWTNNGTFTGNTGTVTFNKNGNQTLTGTGINNFNFIRLQEGTGINNTLEVLASNFTAPADFLTLVNGTFKLSGTYSFANTFFVGPAYNIQPGCGLWLNNPNVTVLAQSGNASVRGLLRITSGSYNIGNAVDNSLVYVSGSVINIEGGSLNIAGQFTRNNATATTSYTQSGGTVTVVGQGSTDPTFAGFDLGAVGSTFTMSGGSIVIRNATSAPMDFLNASSITTVTGGTIQAGDASTLNAQIIRIQSPHPIGNLLISNSTSQVQKPSVQLISSSLTVVGNISIQSGTSLNANGLNIILGGDWSDEGSYTNGNTVTFNGSGSESISKTTGEGFFNLLINKSGGVLSLNNNVTVNNSFSLSLGTLSIGTNTLTLNSTVNGGGILMSAASGTLIYNQSSAGQNILTGNYGNLSFSNFDKILASSGTIGISGLFTSGTATGHTTSGSTLDFNGGSQVIPVFPYNNLTLSGSGTKTASSAITVAGNFSNSNGITFTGITLILNGITHINYGVLNVANLTIATGGSITNNGTTTSTSDLNGGGIFTQGANSILNINGLASISILDVSAQGNTVNFGGTSQTINPLNYQNLTLSGSGLPVLTGVVSINGNLLLTGSVSVTAPGGLNIAGNFSVGQGTSFTAGTFSHTVKGNFSVTGILNPGTGTFTLNGTSIQTLSGSPFYNLTSQNPNGISMLTDVTVNGSMTVINGNLSTGTNSIILGPVATLSEAAGQPILGSISTTRNITATTGTETFGNIGADLNLNGTSPGNTTILRKTGIISTGNGFSSIKRYFDITPTTNTALNAGLVIHYDQTELNGQNANTLELYKSENNGLNWNNLGGIANSTSKTITVTGIDNFSRWTAADTNNHLGHTFTPVIVSISPSSKSVGDSAFILTVIGSGFVNAKSVVRFNGINKPTIFVNPGQLTATIAAGDIAVAGSIPVVVYNNGGGGLSNSQLFIVNPPTAILQGTITYKNSSNTPIPNSEVILKQNGTVISQTTTDLLGHYSFSGLNAGTYTIACNISLPWGGGNAIDALLIMKHFVGISSLSGLNLQVANLGGSPSINSVDALFVTKRFVGSIGNFGVADWQLEPNIHTLTVPGIFEANLKVLCAGDVDGSYIPAP